jgi:AcrR family transcriptional regulator
MAETNLNERLNKSEASSGAATKQAILEVGERLFGEHGIEGTSLRQITSEAGVNLASVHYHFGSKDGLLRAVFTNRLGRLNDARLALLDDAERTGGTEGPELSRIIRAFVTPAIRMAGERPKFMQICGRFYSQPDQETKDFFLAQFEEVVIRFRAALVRALPELPVEDLFWRMQFLVGAMIHTCTNHEDITKLSGGLCKFDTDPVIERLVSYATAAMAAPGAQK